MSLQHLVIDRIAVIGAISRDQTDWALDLVQQIRERRDVTDIIRRQLDRDDLLRPRIDCEMQFAPAPARSDPCF